MIKSEELTNPNSCMSRAKDNEMTFVLLARDIAAPETIRHWASLRISLGKNKHTDPQIVEALEAARTMEQQRLAPPEPASERGVTEAVMFVQPVVRPPDAVD